MRRRNLKKLFALTVATVMATSSVPVQAYATETEIQIQQVDQTNDTGNGQNFDNEEGSGSENGNEENLGEEEEKNEGNSGSESGNEENLGEEEKNEGNSSSGSGNEENLGEEEEKNEENSSSNQEENGSENQNNEEKVNETDQEIQNIQALQPVLSVNFDDGTATDVSGNNNNGEVHGEVEFVDAGTHGKAIHIQNSMDVAGQAKAAEQYVDFGEVEDLQFGTEDFSIGFWYKTKHGDSGKEGSIISNKDWNSGNNPGLNFGDMNQGINMNYRAGGTGRKETDRFGEVTDGEWHYITGTFDRDGKMTLYIDGELPTKGNGYGNGQAEVDISDQQNNIDVTNFVLGADGTKNYGLLDGYIDDLTVYKQVLTQEQVKELQGTDTPESENYDTPVFDVSFDGTTIDSVTGTSGKINGNVEFVDGVKGQAVHIVNSEEIAGKNTKAEQYIDFGVSDNLKFGSEDFSIMFWYQADPALKGEGAVVSSKDWSSGGNHGFTIGDMNNGMTLNFNAGSGRIDTSRTNAPTEKGVWHHVAAVFNRTGSMTLYVDGNAVASKSISSQKGMSIDVDGIPFVVGADGKYQCGVRDSYIDELKVYKKALTQEEIQNYNAPYVLQNQLDEYEKLLEISDADENRKKAFQEAIDDIRARAEGVTDIEIMKQLQEELKAAYNKFIDPEDGIMSFEVISDTHIPGTDNNNVTNKKLIDALDDMEEDYAQKPSVVLNAGDFSADGAENQVKGYFDIINRYKDSFDFVTAVGNHDVRWKSGWEEVEDRYLRYNQEYMGDTPEGQSYYDKWINGYHFIVLNTQWDTKDRAYLSPEELDWLDKTLAEGASPDKPIFIVLHQALYDTYTYSNPWPIGVQDHQLKEILRKYPQSFIFTGHIHDGLGEIDVMRTDFGTVVDVPSMKDNDYGDRRGQLGFHVTVYDDKVSLNLRDYLNDTWVEEYSYTFDVNANAYPSGKALDISFDDGTANDSTGNGMHGTINGNVTFTEGVDGGKAVHIQNDGDKTEQYIDFGDINLGTDDFTVMFWMKQNQGVTNDGTILDHSDEEERSGFTIETKNGKNIQIETGSNKTKEYALADGKWHAVSVTFDRDGKMILYIDGQKKEEQDISSWKDVSAELENFVLGANSDYENGVEDIYIDNLKVYRNVVGAKEISTTWTPYEITTDENSITISWPLPTEDVDPDNNGVEPRTLYLDGKKVADIKTGETTKTIEGLQEGKTYKIELETREVNNNNNKRDVYAFVVTTKKVITYEQLESFYNDVYKKDMSSYSFVVQEKWNKALKDVKFVLESENPTNEKIEQVFEAMKEIFDSLEAKADMSMLHQMVGKAKEILKSAGDYTEESKKKLESAVQEGEKLLSQDIGKDSQELIQQAVQNIQNAIDTLVKNPDDGGNTGGSDNGGNTGSSDNGGNTGGSDNGGNTGGSNNGGNTGGSNNGENTDSSNNGNGSESDETVDIDDDDVPLGDKTEGKKFTISKISNQVYTGKSIKPKMVVKVGSKVLKEGKDYKVTYKNNNKIGKVTVRITGIGKYKGTNATRSFSIVPKKPSVQVKTGKTSMRVTVKGQKGTKTIIRYSSNNGKTWKTVTTSAKTKTISGLKKGTYKIRVQSYKKVNGVAYKSATVSKNKIRIK